MKKAVVTGANGFVGSAVCRTLTDRGVKVIAVVRSADSDISSIADLRGMDTVYCAISDYGSLPNLIADRDIDVIYHFAWDGSAGQKRGDEKTQIDNIKCSCELVRACALMGCRRFIFASSVMIYEIMAQIEGGHIPGINTLYCTAKLAADYMSFAIASASGVEYIRAVISNIYGPGEESPRLINTSLRKLLRGEHCAFSTGEQLYDFIYRDDAAVAFADIGEKGIAGKTYYIGNPSPRPLKEFLMELRDQVDPGISIGLGELPFDGISLSYSEFDTKALERDVGFVSRVTFKENRRQNILYW